MFERIRSVFASEPLDVEAVSAAAPWRTLDHEVAELFLHQCSAPSPRPSPRSGGLLDSDEVVLIAWARTAHLHAFDGVGQYIGIVPTGEKGGLGGWDQTVQFMDRRGVAFSMRFWSRQATTVFTGRTAAEVTGPTGAVIGSCYEGRGSFRRDGRVVGPDGALLASARAGSGTDAQGELTNPSGERLARFWPAKWKKTATRRIRMAQIVTFDPLASADVRALTLTGGFCDEIQARKDDRIG